MCSLHRISASLGGGIDLCELQRIAAILGLNDNHKRFPGRYATGSYSGDLIKAIRGGIFDTNLASLEKRQVIPEFYVFLF